MARLKGGIHGRVSGRVGNLVYYSSGEAQLVRTASAGPKKFSRGQKANQSSFKIRQKWLSPLSPFLKVGCRNTIPHVGGPALALKYLSAHAVSGAGEATVIHPDRVLVSMGDLPTAPNASAEIDAQEVVFSWDPEVDHTGSAFDGVLALAYPAEKEIAYYMLKGHFRKEGSVRLPVQEKGLYHCYLAFVAEDYSRQSDSQFLGTLEVE